MMLAEIVDPTAVWQTIVAALAAGIGVTAVFAIAVFAIARSIELGLDGRTAVAAAFGAIAAIAIVACVGAVVVGVIVMTSK
jgi:hypothetical protein